MASFKVGTLVSLASTTTNAKGKMRRSVAPRAQPSPDSLTRQEITATSKLFCERATSAVGKSRASRVVIPACLNVSWNLDKTERSGCTTSASLTSGLGAEVMAALSSRNFSCQHIALLQPANGTLEFIQIYRLGGEIIHTHVESSLGVTKIGIAGADHYHRARVQQHGCTRHIKPDIMPLHVEIGNHGIEQD